MEMFAIIYQPTGVQDGLYVDKENGIKRCKHLSESRDFIVARVRVEQLGKIKLTREGDTDE